MEYKKTAEVTGDLIGNKITRVSKHSEIGTNENDKEIPRERYISLEERQKKY